MSRSEAPPSSGFPWKPALYWTVTGFFITFGIAGLFSIGIFFLIAAAALIVWAIIRKVPPRTLPATLIGGGLTPLYIAAINWRGPGMHCRETATRQICAEHLDPLPFAGVGFALVVIGTLALILIHKRSRR